MSKGTETLLPCRETQRLCSLAKGDSLCRRRERERASGERQRYTLLFPAETLASVLTSDGYTLLTWQETQQLLSLVKRESHCGTVTPRDERLFSTTTILSCPAVQRPCEPPNIRKVALARIFEIFVKIRPAIDLSTTRHWGVVVHLTSQLVGPSGASCSGPGNS